MIAPHVASNARHSAVCARMTWRTVKSARTPAVGVPNRAVRRLSDARFGPAGPVGGATSLRIKRTTKVITT